MKLTSWAAITGWRLLLVSQFPWQKWPRKWQPGCQDAWFRFCCAFGLLQWSLVGKKTCISCWCFAGCIVCTTTRRFFCDAIEGSFVGHRHWGDTGWAHQKVTPSEGSAFCRSEKPFTFPVDFQVAFAIPFVSRATSMYILCRGGLVDGILVFPSEKSGATSPRSIFLPSKIQWNLVVTGTMEWIMTFP